MSPDDTLSDEKIYFLVNIPNLLASTTIKAFMDKSSPHLILTSLQGVDAGRNGNAGVSERTSR